MNDVDFDKQLRDALGRRADAAPHVDLAQAALTRAGGIRRRRRVLYGAAAVAVAAIVIPVGARFVDADSPDHTASRPTEDGTVSKPVDVAIAGLEPGGAPSVPYIDGPEFHPAAGPASSITARGRIVDAVQLEDAVAVWSLDTATGTITYAADNDHTSLPQGPSVSSPAVNLADHAAAWSVGRTKATAGHYQDGDRLALTDTESGELATTSIGMDTVSQVMGVHDDAVIYNGRQGRERYVGLVDFGADVNDAQIPWPDATNVTAVDPKLVRMAGQTDDMRAPDRSCTVMFNLDDSAAEWQTCDWRPVEFSPDGDLVLAIRPDVDGLGPRDLAVMKADDGSVLRSFTTQGTFGRATFEGDASIDAVLNVGDQAAIVRCSIDTGDCELATEPATVAPDDPDSLVYPYQLTAN